MKFNKLYCFLIINTLFFFSIKGISQSVLPTDTSPVGFDAAPVGWTIIFGSTDVSDKDLWGGVSPWLAPVDDPPNGDTVWVTGIYNETVATTISDLIIGVDYSFDFYMSELAQSDWILDEDGTLEVIVDGVSYLYPYTGGYDFSWSLQTLEFTATAPSVLMSFKYETYIPHCWNVSFGSDLEITCDTLESYVSAVGVCTGEAVTLSAESSNGGLVTWDGGISDGVPFVPPLGTTLYMATSDNEDDCAFGIEITMSEYPEFDISVDDDEICDGESVIISIDGDAEIFEWNIPDVEVDEPYYPDIGAIDYILTGTNGICETSETVLITAHANPIVDATVEDASICFGESFVFNGEGADIYSWDSGVIDGVEFTPLAPGIAAYFVIGIDTVTSCESIDYVYATAHGLPDVVANADNDDICEGDEVTLTGSGASSYEWDLGITDGIAFEPPLGTTTYTVIGTSIFGCENTSTIDITVSAVPEVTIIAIDAEICEGDEITLTGVGADSYEWDLGVIDSEAFIPDGLGVITYTITGLSVAGCEGIATINILVNEGPEITVSASPMEICAGESVVFTGAGADAFVWEDGIVDGIAYVIDDTGDIEYTATGTDTETGCSNTASVIITVHDSPIVGATATTTEFCFGESTILAGTGADSYTWTGGITNGVSFSPATIGATTYTVTGINEYGCEATASITITAIECVPVYAGFELPNSLCLNDCITIKDTSSGPVSEWEWDFGGVSDPNYSSVQNPKICLNSIGTFTITLTVTAETGATSTITQDLIVNSNPTINASIDTIIDLGGTADLISSSSFEGDFIWAPDIALECPDCAITKASPSQNQLYTILLIDDNGCKASDSVMVLVNYLLSVGVPSAFSPNGDGNNDVLFVKGIGIESIYFAVYNRYGELIFETTDQRIGWDGTHLNKAENPGVFTWVLDYTNQDNLSRRLKGNTTLIR